MRSDALQRDFTPPGASRPLPRIDFWSIWNEPNIETNLGPETTHRGSGVEVAPAIYRDLLNGAWGPLQVTGHGRDRILIGELARGPIYLMAEMSKVSRPCFRWFGSA
jgi:hypothetical protein